jgi:hypothetical protein
MLEHKRGASLLHFAFLIFFEHLNKCLNHILVLFEFDELFFMNGVLCKRFTLS